MIWKRLRLTLEMIKFEHSVFALPFALTGALLAFREGSYTAAAIGRTLLWIAVAMVLLAIVLIMKQTEPTQAEANLKSEAQP